MKPSFVAALFVGVAVLLAPCAEGQAVQEGGAYHVPLNATDASGAAYPGNAAHMMNGLTRKNVYTEAELRAAMDNPFISEIWLMRNMTLSGTPLPALKNLRRLTIFGAYTFLSSVALGEARGGGGSLVVKLSPAFLPVVVKPSSRFPPSSPRTRSHAHTPAEQHPNPAASSYVVARPIFFSTPF